MRLLTLLLLLLLASPVHAADLVPGKRMTLELAQEIAKRALDTCRSQGYQVVAAVVDREGPVVILRDTYATRFNIQIAKDKANGVILSGVASSVFRANRQDIRMEMNHVNGVLVLEGAVPIRAAGVLLGAVGVSGAPGGDKDEICAAKAVAEVQDRLDLD